MIGATSHLYQDTHGGQCSTNEKERKAPVKPEWYFYQSANKFRDSATTLRFIPGFILYLAIN
jgi:hypothetical protein